MKFTTFGVGVNSTILRWFGSAEMTVTTNFSMMRPCFTGYSFQGVLSVAVDYI